jgi:hypothetical protein
MAVSPTSQSVVAGSNTTYSVELSAVGGYSFQVNLAVNGLPAGATASSDPAALNPTGAGASSTLAIATGAVPPTGGYDLKNSNIIGKPAAGPQYQFMPRR